MAAESEVARIGCRRADLRSGGKFVSVKRFRPGSLNRYQKSTAKKSFSLSDSGVAGDYHRLEALASDVRNQIHGHVKSF